MLPLSPPLAGNENPEGAIATCDVLEGHTIAIQDGPSPSDKDKVELVTAPMSPPQVSISPIELIEPIEPTQTETPTETQTESQKQTQKHSSHSSQPDSIVAGKPIEYEYEELPGGHRLLRFKPTPAQWVEFPSIFSLARSLGAATEGCFKMVLPHEMRHPLPARARQELPANAYVAYQIRSRMFWQVSTVATTGTFSSHEAEANDSATPEAAVKSLKTLFNRTKKKRMPNVRYRVDVPAWTPDQRRKAGVPEPSPLHPLKGDQLNHTKAIIPGIHTPYVYESAPYFGATFQLHAEDFRLTSLNHLYKGRKIWIVVPATAVDVAEEALNRKGKCSQFMRHRAEFFFPERLEKMGIPYRIVDQRPGETMVILPDAYHEGFSTGYTIAEAKNYADADWDPNKYQPCQLSCKLITAIPGEFMRPVGEDEARIDLCKGDEKPTASAPPPSPLPSLPPSLPSLQSPPSLPPPSTPSSTLSSCSSPLSSPISLTLSPQQTPSLKRACDQDAEMQEEPGAKQIKVC